MPPKKRTSAGKAKAKPSGDAAAPDPPSLGPTPPGRKWGFGWSASRKPALGLRPVRSLPAFPAFLPCPPIGRARPCRSRMCGLVAKPVLFLL